MNLPPSKSHRPAPDRLWTPHLAAVLGVLLTFVVFWTFREAALQRFTNQFDRTAEARANLITHQLEETFLLARAAGQFFEASEKVTRSEFSAFTVPLIANHFPVQAFEWAPAVKREERAALDRKSTRLNSSH